MARGARRVLVTGVANAFGVRVASRLRDVPGVEQVIGIDTRTPPPEVASSITFIDADLRSPDLPRLLKAAAPDAVVHNDIVQFPEPGRSLRQAHDVNVIGTLQLMTAAAQLEDLKAIVVRGSAIIYGSEPGAPAFFTEDITARGPLRTRWQRDVAELESLVSTFSRRHAGVPCTMLRMQPVIGRDLDTPIRQYVRRFPIPTYLGYDPRIQVLDADDAVDALVHAVQHPVDGPVNVAADGVVSLQRVLRRAGRPSLPLPAPLFERVSGVNKDVARYLKYGRGVDTTRMREELGFRPRHTTLEALEAAIA